MPGSLYEYALGAIGFSLIVLGMGFLLPARFDRALRAFGSLYAAIGFLLATSAFRPVLALPASVDGLVLAAGLLVLGLALFEIVLFVFGGERKEGSGKWIYGIGAAWSVLLWGLALREGEPQGLVSCALYAWPFAAPIAGYRLGKRSSSSLPRGARGPALASGIAALAMVGMSFAPHRLGRCLLEALMLGWYVYLLRNPSAIVDLRDKVAAE